MAKNGRFFVWKGAFGSHGNLKCTFSQNNDNQLYSIIIGRAEKSVAKKVSSFTFNAPRLMRHFFRGRCLHTVLGIEFSDTFKRNGHALAHSHKCLQVFSFKNNVLHLLVNVFCAEITHNVFVFIAFQVKIYFTTLCSNIIRTRMSVCQPGTSTYLCHEMSS